MANMIDLESKSKLSYYSNSETRSLFDLELMESFFCPFRINPVSIELSIINEEWPSFSIILRP